MWFGATLARPDAERRRLNTPALSAASKRPPDPSIAASMMHPCRGTHKGNYVMQRTTTLTNLYAYPDQSWSAMNLAGFKVEATNGEIGAIDEKTYEIGADALVVDTGPWIFGRKFLLPAGLINRIDEMDHRIFLTCSKDQVENAPEFDESRLRDQTYRDELGTYYTNRPAGPDFGATDSTIR